ncbi:MAG: hypothetical protein ACRDZ2_13865, partial [Ilumatobacteraceae bacterium]
SDVAMDEQLDPANRRDDPGSVALIEDRAPAEAPARRVEVPVEDETHRAARRVRQTTPWFVRAGRRTVRRPERWARRPWPPSRIVQVTITTLTLFITTVIMMNVVHFNPINASADLIFDATTPTGGDMGAHVWGPAYLRDQLLANFQLSGWSMDWYAGMPVYRFYMVVPALAIVALDTVFAYGVAFKLVAISGLVTLPLCCWAFGRLANFRYPLPELFAFAGMAFALDESFSIYGGNLKSTMAGEFSFSIALSLMILGFGLLARGMQTGKYRSWAAIVLALAAVCHGIVLIYTAIGALVIVLINSDSGKRLRYGLTVGLGTLLLSAFWVGPFLLNHEYMTDMKYGGRPEGAEDSFYDMFFPLTPPLDILITSLAIIGFVACVARRHLNGTALGITGLLTLAAVYATRESLPIIGLLWNPRLLPFLYFIRYLLMMVGIIEVAGLLANLWRDGSPRRLLGWVGGSATAGAVGISMLVVLGFMYEVLPGAGKTTENGKSVYSWGPFRKTPDGADAQGDGWSRYNFMGYEGRTYYPEYHDVVQTMAEIGRTNGCGRATWENNEDNGQYGTTMALMLLPHWTDGCIASMEGLFFEASGTTPYHFLTTAAMSNQSSNPVRELRYVDNDAGMGVRHLQDLGVRYTMVRTDEAKREAAEHPELELLATSGPWDIYQVADSDIVVPLDVQPVVVNGRDGDQRERNLELGTSWFQQPEEWAAMPADDGPPAWQRIDVVVDGSRVVPEIRPAGEDPDTRGEQVDIVVPQQPIDAVALPEVAVSDVQMGEQELSFRVDQVGVPVLVKVSYFPNWQVEGADGPYRIAPNMMVVVPTQQEVRLHYGRTTSDYFFYAMTIVGIGMLIFLRRKGDVRFDDVAPAGAPAAGGDDDIHDGRPLDELPQPRWSDDAMPPDDRLGSAARASPRPDPGDGRAEPG